MSLITVKTTSINSNIIKDDLLKSFQLLENDALKLKAMKKEGIYPLDELSKITNSTINAINVYNQNHNHILQAFDNFRAGKSISGQPIYSFPDFTHYLTLHPNTLEAMYEKQELHHRSIVMANAEELKQLGNLCTYFETLALKIDVNFNKIKNCITSIQSVGPLELTYGKLDLKLTKVNPKSLHEFALSSQELRAAPETSPNENLHIWQQTPPAPSSAAVTINFDVGFGNTLGICCEPDWEKQPIVLSNAGNDWSGNIPTGKNWKFVILKDSQVINWEMAEDRKCEANSSACNYTGQVKFS